METDTYSITIFLERASQTPGKSTEVLAMKTAGREKEYDKKL